MSNLELKGLKGLRNLGDLIQESQIIKADYEQLERLPIEYLTQGKYQPRRQLNDGALNELADSIKSHGVIQPIIARRLEKNNYEIIAGERRWHAAKIAGLTHIPAIIRDMEDNVALALSLIENIQRENLNPIEEALAFKRFLDEFSLTHDEIATIVGRSRVAVTNSLRLLLLCESVREMLQIGQLDMGHARALLSLNAEQQNRLALDVVKKQLSVRETERLAALMKHLNVIEHKNEMNDYRQECNQWASVLSEMLSKTVSVKLNNNGTGKVIIEVHSPEEIDWLLNHIKIE